MERTECRNCGARHFDGSRNARDCKGYLRVSDWQASAAGIRELAAQAREDGERHFAKAVRLGSASRLEQARAAYARAHELED